MNRGENIFPTEVDMYGSFRHKQIVQKVHRETTHPGAPEGLGSPLCVWGWLWGTLCSGLRGPSGPEGRIGTAASPLADGDGRDAEPHLEPRVVLARQPRPGRDQGRRGVGRWGGGGKEGGRPGCLPGLRTTWEGVRMDSKKILELRNPGTLDRIGRGMWLQKHGGASTHCLTWRGGGGRRGVDQG